MLVLYKSYKFKSLSLLLVMSLMGSNLYFCSPSQGAADAGDLNFKVYNPNNTGETSATTANSGSIATPDLSKETPANDTSQPAEQADNKIIVPLNPSLSDPTTVDSKIGEDKTDDGSKNGEISTTANPEDEGKTKLLQGYVRVVPTGTKISIIMDTAVDSDTSQEGDEFSARTAEDLTIDGTTAVPAGSIIRGRIATLNAPKHLNRSGSVALKFDSVTTPDNRQIPLVANLVARGGVVHARRGLKDIAIDTGTFALPTAIALGIGAVAGHSSSSVGVGGGALIGAAVGAAIGVCILMAKKGKRVDVRPGDELKIELAEDLHMPSM